MGSGTKNVISGVLAGILAVLVVTAGPVFAGNGQAGPPAGGCTGNCTMRGATLKPGPLRVGGGGISTDGGIYAYGDVTSLGSIRTYDSSNLTHNWRQSTFNGTTSFEQNGAAALNCAVSGTTCTFSYHLATSAVTGTSITSAAAVTGTTKLRSIGAATGSLQTCNAGAKGSIETDTTRSAPKFCNGTAHRSLGPTVAFLDGYFPPLPAAAAQVVTGTRFTEEAQLTRLAVTGVIPWGGGTNISVTVVRVTGGPTVLCTKTIGCITTGNTSGACTGDISVADDVTINIDTSACTGAQGAVNIAAEFTTRD